MSEGEKLPEVKSYIKDPETKEALQRRTKRLIDTGVPDKPRIEGKQRSVAENTALRQLATERKISNTAIKDKLTDLYNRRWLDDALPRLLAISERNNSPFSLMYIDLDHFKEANDAAGHGVGDRVLKTFADIFRRESDIVVRNGGDEFVILLPNTPARIEDKDGNITGGALKLANDLFAHVNDRDTWNFLPANVPEPTCSIGIVQQRRETATMLISNADAAMFRAKAEGGGKAVIWNEVFSPIPTTPNSPM